MENFWLDEEKFSKAEYIQLDKEIMVDENTNPDNLYAYRSNSKKDLKLSISWDVSFILVSLWTKDHNIFDEPEFNPIISQRGDSCYIFRYGWYVVSSLTMSEINNPDNCKIIALPSELTNNRILYFHFPILEEIGWWSVKFQELDKSGIEY